MSFVAARWGGDFRFLMRNLLLKDFRVRYRNMSLGLGWSVANPLVMMAVLTFVFTKVMTGSDSRSFPAFVMCGLVPFNFFALSWLIGTVSIVENAGLIKRVRFPREIIPISTVLANTLHFAIQIVLVLVLVVISGYPPTRHWVWIPIVAAFEVIFVCGMALMFSALDVYVRDMRYLVESANTVLFWLVPIFYSFSIIPEQYHPIYRLNPVAAVVMAFRNVLLEGRPPAQTLLLNLVLVSSISLGLGFLVFNVLRRRFYDYL
jgi:lipopolysaccharide transport system permease protein